MHSEKLTVPTPEQKEAEAEKPFILIRPEGTYVTFFGIHTEETKLTDEALGCDAYFIECMGDWTSSGFLATTDEMQAKDFDVLGKISMQAKQTDSFARLAKNTNKPICYGDLHVSWANITLDVLIKITETAWGAKILKSISNPQITKKSSSLSRRNFLIKATKSVVASWLLLPFFADLLMLYKNTHLREISRETHPEINIFTTRLRDLIITYKEQWFLENATNHGKVCNVMGLAHSEQKRLLNTPLKEKELAIKQMMPLYKLCTATPATFYSIQFCTPDNTSNNLVEIPELKQIWEQQNNTKN